MSGSDDRSDDETVVEYKANGVVQKVTLGELKVRAAKADGAERSMQEAAESRRILDLAKKAVVEGDWEAEKTFRKFLGMSDEKIAEVEALRMYLENLEAGGADEAVDPGQAPLTRDEFIRIEQQKEEQARVQAGNRVVESLYQYVDELLDSTANQSIIDKNYGDNAKGREGFVRRWNREAREGALESLRKAANRGEPIDLMRIRDSAKKAVEESFKDLKETWPIGHATRTLGRVPDTSGLEDFGQISPPKLPKPLGEVSEEDMSKFMKDSLKYEMARTLSERSV